MITPEQIAKSGSEHSEQSALFAHAAIQARSNTLWALLFAIPNGGKRDKITAARLKAEGVKPGVPDICLPVARGGYHAFYIELKRIEDREKDRRAGETSTKQDCWIANLKEQGNATFVAYGWLEARASIETYLTWEPSGIFWYDKDGTILTRIA